MFTVQPMFSAALSSGMNALVSNILKIVQNFLQNLIFWKLEILHHVCFTIDFCWNCIMCLPQNWLFSGSQMAVLYYQRLNPSCPMQRQIFQYVALHLFQSCLFLTQPKCFFSLCASTIFSFKSTIFSFKSTIFSFKSTLFSFKSTIFSWWWWLYFSTASKGFSLNLYLTFRRVLRMNPHQALSTKPLSNFLEYTIPLSSVCLFHFSACISQTRALQCIALHCHMAWAPEGREGQS